MVPTMCRTLGVKGHRPVVGTWDCKDLLYVSASVDTITGQLVSNTLESPADAKRKTGQSKTRRMQQAFADHLFKTRGISVKKSAVQAFCRKHEIRPYRPSYRFLRGDPGKQAEAKVELAALKKGRKTASSCC
jgi:hypothetical protein